MAASKSHDTYADEHLTCRICFQLFDNAERTPRILGCMHTICDTCITKLTERNTYVLCPFCKNTWQIPSNGFPENTLVKSLLFNRGNAVKAENVPQKVDCENCADTSASNTAVGFCNDCEMNVCETCIKNHKLMKITKDHEIEKLSQLTTQFKRKRSATSRCKSHLKENLSVFCSTCKTTTCNTCFITDHHGHKCVDLQKAVDKTKNKLMLLAEQCKGKLQPLHQLLSKIDDVTGSIDGILTQHEQIVDQVFKSLSEKIEEQSRKAKIEIRNLCDNKKQSLKKQREDIKSTCAEYEIASDFADQLYKLSKPEELLDLQEQVTHRLEELIRRDDNDPKLLTPLTNTHAQLNEDNVQAAEEFKDVVSRLGHFRTSPSIPSLCYAESTDIPRKRQEAGGMVINRDQKMKIHAMYFDQEVTKNDEGGDSFTAALNNASDTTTECRVEDHGDGTYTVLYTPTVSGKHTLDVKLFGQSISGSPFSFKAFPMKYQPVNIKQGPSVTYQEVPIVGVPHSINLNLSDWQDRDEGVEPEAKVNAIAATICSDDNVDISNRVVREEDEARLIYTPPTVGNLHVSIRVNGRPVVETFQIFVTNLENSLISWQQEQPPVVGQQWVLTVNLRNHSQEQINLDSSTLGVVIFDPSGKPIEKFVPRSQMVDSKHEFECVCSHAGTQQISLQMNGINVKIVSLKALDRLYFNTSENKSSFPSSVESSQSGEIYLSDTKLGCVYARRSDNKRLPDIKVDTRMVSSQLTSDEQNALYLLVVEHRYVQVVTNNGKNIAQWKCDEKNRKPVTIAASRYKHEDLVVIGDCSHNAHALFIYQKNGTLLSSIPLPSGCLMDGLDNICIDKNGFILICSFQSPEIIQIDSKNGHEMKSVRTSARNKQLAITTTAEGLVLVSEKGRINVYNLNDEGVVIDCKVIQTNDHIYTSLSGIPDGCVVGLDVKLQQLTKYGYLHL